MLYRSLVGSKLVAREEKQSQPFASRGFYPKGGGEVHIEVQPVQQLRAVDLTSRGAVNCVKGKAFVARLNDRVSVFGGLAS